MHASFWCKRVKEPFFSLRAISKIQRNYQNCHIVVWKDLIKKIYRSAYGPLSTPGVKIELIFALRCSGFRYMG